jgi:hypothetical protein
MRSLGRLGFVLGGRQSFLALRFLMGFARHQAGQLGIGFGKATCGFGHLQGLGTGNGLAEIPSTGSCWYLVRSAP